MHSKARHAPDNARRARPILSVKQVGQAPVTFSFLAGAEDHFDTKELAEAQAWGEAVWAARNAWDVSRRQKGGFRHG